MERTGVNPDDVTYVNAHGTSTQAGDMAEYRCGSSLGTVQHCLYEGVTQRIVNIGEVTKILLKYSGVSCKHL